MTNRGGLCTLLSIMTLILMLSASAAVSNETDQERISAGVSRLIATSPLDRRYALKISANSRERGGEETLSRLIADAEAELLLQSAGEIIILNREVTNDAWQEATEFGDIDLTELAKISDADAAIIIEAQFFSEGISAIFRSVSLKEGDLGRTLGSSGTVTLSKDYAISNGIDVGGFSDQLSAIIENQGKEQKASEDLKKQLEIVQRELTRNAEQPTTAPKDIDSGSDYLNLDYRGLEFDIKANVSIVPDASLPDDAYNRYFASISQENCSMYCANFPSCAAFSFNGKERACALFKAPFTIKDNVGFVTGVKQAEQLNATTNSEFLEISEEEIVGDDIVSAGYRGATLAQCRKICLRYSECAAFSWDKNSSTCWLKRTIQRREDRPSFVSGTRTNVSPSNSQNVSSEGLYMPDELSSPRVSFDKFEMLPGQKLNGHVILPVRMDVHDLSACKDVCEGLPNCVGFTFEPELNVCRPFSDVFSQISSPFSASGVLKIDEQSATSEQTSNAAGVDKPSQAVKYELIAGMDIAGGDLTTSGFRGVSIEQCARICKTTSGCKAAAWVGESEWCWPKSISEPLVAKNGVATILLENEKNEMTDAEEYEGGTTEVLPEAVQPRLPFERSLNCSFDNYNHAGVSIDIAQSWMPREQVHAIVDETRVTRFENFGISGEVLESGSDRLKLKYTSVMDQEGKKSGIRVTYRLTYFPRTGLVISNVDFLGYQTMGPIRGTCELN